MFDKSTGLVKKTVVAGMLMSSIVQPVNAQVEQDGGKGLAFLIPAIMQAASSAVGMGAQTLFSNFFNWLARPVNCALGGEAGNQAYGYQQPYGGYNQGMGYGGMQPSSGSNCNRNEQVAVPAGATPVQNNQTFNQPTAQAGLNAGDLQVLSSRPAVALQVLKYAGKDIGVAPTETMSLGAGDQLRFDIRTGEHFAIKFDTSVPGRVRLINTDSAGKVETVGNYEVIGSSENRMPRRTNIEMLGIPGAETLDVVFTPCISPALANDARVAQFKPYLVACSEEAATKQFAPVAMKRMLGVKGMGNSEYSPSNTTALMASTEAVSKGSTLSFRINVNHLPNGGAGVSGQGVVQGNL